MPPSTHKIENAKSGRSKCKRCKEVIADGELRIVTEAYSETRDMDFTSNYHTQCFKVPPRAMAGVSPEEFVDEHLEDCSNDDVLSDPETLAEIIADITLATNAPKKKATKKKSKAETNEEEEDCRPAKKAKKAKKKAPVKSEEVTEDDDDTSDDSEKGDSSSASSTSEQQWVGCDSCGKWRKLPANTSPDTLPDEWYCNMNTWDTCFATCEAAEEEGA